MATKKYTITLDENIRKEFDRISETSGTKFSTWVNQKVKEYVNKEGGKK